jgi:hypothetical protein
MEITLSYNCNSNTFGNSCGGIQVEIPYFSGNVFNSYCRGITLENEETASGQN